jgi:hypothetical protein
MKAADLRQRFGPKPKSSGRSFRSFRSAAFMHRSWDDELLCLPRDAEQATHAVLRPC